MDFIGFEKKKSTTSIRYDILYNIFLYNIIAEMLLIINKNNVRFCHMPYILVFMWPDAYPGAYWYNMYIELVLFCTEPFNLEHNERNL